MDEAAATRRAALDAVGDIEPAGLYERIETHLETGSMVPGVLTILTVRATTDGASGAATDENNALLDAVSRRAAGVQLIYDGLRLTRELATEEPWTAGEKATGDLDVLVADVLVARGFYLLARTNAADKAVETVRAFGHDQTLDNESSAQNLEQDVIHLAIITGIDCPETALPSAVSEYAATLTSECTIATGGFSTAETVSTESVSDRLAAVAGDSSDGLTTSVDD